MSRKVFDHKVPSYRLLRRDRPEQLFWFQVYKRAPGEYYMSLHFYEDTTRLCFKFGFESEQAAKHVADHLNDKRITLRMVEKLCVHYIDVKYLGMYSPEQVQRLVCDRVNHDAYVDAGNFQPMCETLNDLGEGATA